MSEAEACFILAARLKSDKTAIDKTAAVSLLILSYF